MSSHESTPQHSMGLHPIRPSVNFEPLKRGDTMPMPTLPSLSSSMGSAKRKRSPEKVQQKPNKIVKKSSSTPMMHPGSMSPDSDKKRNKLGYHRTSVACGHCRRRKIRCMMPDDDPTGRCSNCIRLKKECNFYPVDQNVGGKGPHPSNRAVSMPKTGLRSTNSPTPMCLPSSYGDFSHYHGQGHNSFSVPPPDTTGLGLFNTTTANSYNESAVTYSTQYDGPTTSWDSSPYATLPPISAPQETSMYSHGLSSTRHFDSPLSVSPAPPPYTRPSSTFRPSPFPDSAYGSAASCRTPSNEIGWAAPAHQQQTAGAAASTYRASYSPQPHVDERRSTSVNAPPSLIMSGDSAGTPTLSEPSSVAPMSAPSANGGYWQQQPWTPIPGAPSDVMEPSKTFTAAEPFEQSWFPGTEVNGY